MDLNAAYHCLGELVNNSFRLVSIQRFQFCVDFLLSPDVILLTTTMVASFRVVREVLFAFVILMAPIDLPSRLAGELCNSSNTRQIVQQPVPHRLSSNCGSCRTNVNKHGSTNNKRLCKHDGDGNLDAMQLESLLKCSVWVHTRRCRREVGYECIRVE